MEILVLCMIQTFCMWVNMVGLSLWGFLEEKSSRSGRDKAERAMVLSALFLFYLTQENEL